MKRVFSVLLALAFVLSLSGCVSRDTYKTDIIETAESSYERGFEEGYDEGYYFGADDYYEVGHDEGFEEGHAKGLETGQAIGEDDGYRVGYAEGYDEGYADALNIEDQVYVTFSGEKYHRSGCSYLNSSCIVISRDDAIARGYTPCSRCNP